jgi:DNA-directed RNA polymerase specialized sigma24 family protein
MTASPINVDDRLHAEPTDLQSAYRRLLALARRSSRSEAEAEDLLHDALAAALTAGRNPLANADDGPWMYGVLRNLALMRARGEARRRRREELPDPPAEDVVDPPIALDGVLAAMPPAARQVGVLALHGLGPAEIRWVLGLSDAAFRQRLTSIRRSLGRLPDALRADALASALSRPPRAALDFGLIRRALVATLRIGPGTVPGIRLGIGSHDPDGHPIILLASDAHKRAGDGNQ